MMIDDLEDRVDAILKDFDERPQRAMFHSTLDALAMIYRQIRSFSDAEEYGIAKDLTYSANALISALMIEIRRIDSRLDAAIYARPIP